MASLRCCLMWCGIGLLMVGSASAQVEYFTDDSGEDEVFVYRMTVSPAVESVPAFKYRLLRPEWDLKQGNAAPFYYRALLELAPIFKANREEFGEEFDTWYGQASLNEIPLAKAHKALARYEGLQMESLREAARRRDCDWDLQVENIKGPELIATLLPEFHNSRDLSRMLTLRARVAIAEGRLDDAIEAMQINYRMAKDIARPKFLVAALVGMAEAGVMNRALLDLMAATDSPNMYWALAELSQPFIDVRSTTRFELQIGRNVFPILDQAELEGLSPQEWQHRWVQAILDFGSMTDGRYGSIRYAKDSGFTKRDLAGIAAAGIAIWAYPNAKRQLIDSGMDPAEVEALPVGKVVVLQAARYYDRKAHEVEKDLYLSFAESRRRRYAHNALADSRSLAAMKNEVLPIASLLIPATQAARTAEVRLEQSFAAFRVIEALRLYAHANNGRLPERLEDLTIVPVPLNPATDKPFVYRLEGNTAILELPYSDGMAIAKRFEITMRNSSAEHTP